MEQHDVFTVRLPLDLGANIRQEAEQRGISSSVILRERIIAGSAQSNIVSIKIGDYKIPLSDFNNTKLVFENFDKENEEKE
jgi:hypothetical protein